MEELAIFFSAFSQNINQAFKSDDNEDQHSKANAKMLIAQMSWTVSKDPSALLFQGHSNDPANIFRTQAWLDSWIKLAEKHLDKKIKILLGSLNGKTVVAIPLAIRRRRFTSSAKFIAQDVCDYNGLVIHEDLVQNSSAHLINRLIEEIGVLLPSIDYVDLRKVLFKNFSPVNNRIEWQEDLEKSHLVKLSGNWENDLNQFVGGTSRKSLKRKLKKLEKMGQVTFAEITELKEKEKAVKKLCDWKSGQLQELGTANIFEYGIFRDFLVTSVTNDDGKLVRLFGMFVDGEPIALIHMLCTNDRWFLYQTAYTPEEAGKNSPGQMLMLEVLERACNENIPLFDFGWGNEPYKQRYSSESLTVYNAFLPLSAKGQLICMAKKAITALKNFAKSNRYIRSIATLSLRLIAYTKSVG